jgi:hypothetical protein
MEDYKNLEFVASNSKEIVEKQVDSYSQQLHIQLPLLVSRYFSYLFPERP